MRVQSVNLNLIPTGVMPIVHLSQYDRDADGALLFNIFNGPTPYNLTGCTATINGTKPDGNVYTYPCTVHSDFLTSAVYDQMTTVQGTHEAEIRISDGDSVVGTLNFQMAIEKAGVSEIDVSHTDVPTLLEDIQNSVNEAEYWAEQAASSVTGVASFNGRGGSVLPMAGDYNAEQITYNQTSNVDAKLGSLESGLANKVAKTDLVSIITTGQSNSTGATITSGTYFYLNGTLVRAKANIANGATYTLNTNYEEMTAGVLNNPAKSWVVVFYYGTQIGVPNYTRNNNILLKVGHLVFMSCNFNITSRGNGTSPRISTKSYKLPYKPNATAVGTFANSIKTLNMVAEKDNDEYFILKNLDGTDATVTDMAVGDVTLTIVYTTDE